MISVENMPDCERFGIWNGCRKDCPQLERGECELYSSVEEFISKVEHKEVE